MKISQINAYPADGRTQVNIVVDSELSVAEALSSVLALFAGASVVNAAPDRIEQIKAALDAQLAAEAPPAAVNDAEANVVDELAPKATRTRRPRAAADAAPAQEPTPANPEAPGPVAEAAQAVETRRRTRVTAEAPAETVKTITDADLAKACSNAAAIVGIEVVQAVINDFAVKNMQELAPDVRERFLSELEDEIKLAKEEFARAGK